MKTKLLVLALICMSATFGYGFHSIEIHTTANPAVFNLTYDGDESSEPVVVKITDERGNVFAKRCVRSVKHFNLPINFASRQHGKYIVSITVGGQTRIQEISYGDHSSVVAHRPKESGLISHTTQLKEGKYLVSVAKGQISNARVTILNGDNLVVYTTTKEASNGAAFLLNTRNVEGPATIQVTDASAE